MQLIHEDFDNIEDGFTHHHWVVIPLFTHLVVNKNKNGTHTVLSNFLHNLIAQFVDYPASFASFGVDSRRFSREIVSGDGGIGRHTGLKILRA